jgi:hypothetical protein
MVTGERPRAASAPQRMEERLVCCKAFRQGGLLQDLRGKFPRPIALSAFRKSIDTVCGKRSALNSSALTLKRASRPASRASSGVLRELFIGRGLTTLTERAPYPVAREKMERQANVGPLKPPCGDNDTTSRRSPLSAKSHSTRSKSGLCGAGSPLARSTRNLENFPSQ